MFFSFYIISYVNDLKMNIILSNKFYYNRGGDCVATLALEKILKEHGHKTAFFAMKHKDNFTSEWENYFASEINFSSLGFLDKVRATKRIFHPADVKQQFMRLIDDFKPDIVHLNNIHSYISPYIGKLAFEQGIKVIWTQHDYKLVCPAYICMSKGQVCELCFKNPIHVLEKKCMKESFPQSACAYLEALYWNKNKIQKYTNTFIAPSSFLKDSMIRSGFNSSKIEKIHHCIPRNINESILTKDNYYCFVGRFSEEKGVRTLIKAAIDLPYRLVMIGEGPLKKELLCMSKGHNNISFVGFKQWDELKYIVGKAKFLVIPSEWYEVFGLVSIEAQALGTPVLAANIGGIPETIYPDINGILFNPGNLEDLKEKIKNMFQTKFNYNEIADFARQTFSMDQYYNKIIKIYGTYNSNK